MVITLLGLKLSVVELVLELFEVASGGVVGGGAVVEEGVVTHLFVSVQIDFHLAWG